MEKSKNIIRYEVIVYLIDRSIVNVLTVEQDKLFDIKEDFRDKNKTHVCIITTEGMSVFKKDLVESIIMNKKE